MKETWILVLWLGSPNGGPAMTQFDSSEMCEKAKEEISKIYLPDAFVEQTWTTNPFHLWAYEQTKCVKVKVDE